MIAWVQSRVATAIMKESVGSFSLSFCYVCVSDLFLSKGSFCDLAWGPLAMRIGAFVVVMITTGCAVYSWQNPSSASNQ